MLIGKITVSQRLLNTVLYLLGGLFQLHFPQLSHHSFSLFTGGLLAFLGVDRFKHLGHQFYFGARNNGKHITVKMDRASLVFGVRKHFSHGFQHSQTLVPNNEFHAVQSSVFKPLKEIHPTGLVFFHALGSAQNLTVSVLIDRNCYQNRNIFILSAPVAPQIDAIHIDIRILAAL